MKDPRQLTIESPLSHPPTDEEIVQWSNSVDDDAKGYTATGSRIAIHERCEGARWILNKIKGNDR